MELNELIKVVKVNSLIETISDIEFLFEDYTIEDENLPITELIDSAITWAYENDELAAFYAENLDFLIDSGEVECIIGCSIELNTSIRSSTTYELYCFESKNKHYWMAVGSGENADCWDTSDFSEVLDKNSKTDVISRFKDECWEVFTNNGEFDGDELSGDGHSVEFY